MGNLFLRIDGDAAKAVQALEKTIDKQKTLIRELGKTGQESQRGAQKHGKAWSDASGKVLGGLKEIAGALGVGMGIAGAIGLVKKGMQEWKAYMTEVARLSKEAGQNVMAFAMMQAPKEMRPRVLETAAAAIPYGIKAGVAWNQVQAFQAQLGTYKKGLGAARATWQLQRTGVEPEAAASVVSLLMAQGLTGEQAARLPYAAGEVSAKDPAAIAGALPTALPFFGGVKGGALTAAQIATRLSATIPTQQLGTFTKAAGLGLTRRPKFWKGLGFEKPGAKPWEQLAALSAAGLTTTAALETAGITETRQSAALAALVTDMPETTRVAAQVAGKYAQPGLIAGKIAGVEREMPEVVHARKMGAYKAEFEYERTFGTRAQRAREVAEKEAERGLMYEKAGLGEMVGEEGRLGAGEAFWGGLWRSMFMDVRSHFINYGRVIAENTKALEKQAPSTLQGPPDRDR